MQQGPTCPSLSPSAHLSTPQASGKLNMLCVLQFRYPEDSRPILIAQQMLRVCYVLM